ncbi:MAG: hypothetical protein SFY81_11200 [Verrucomicrobiota bacterium]|nr:hypothetical protein [Verrucomicrobiota bacterium]
MIKFIFRWAFRLFILLIVLLVALLLLKDTIFKTITESQIRAQTGLEVSIGRLETSLSQPSLTIENFILYNSAEFGGGPLLHVPDLRIEYSLDEKGSVRFKLLRLNLRELNIIENHAGQTNLLSLVAAINKAEEEKRRRNKSSQTNQFNGIDTLNLSVGTIRFISLKSPQKNQEIKINLNHEIVQNIRTWQDTSALLFKILLRAGIVLYMDRHRSPPPTITTPPSNPTQVLPKKPLPTTPQSTPPR